MLVQALVNNGTRGIPIVLATLGFGVSNGCLSVMDSRSQEVDFNKLILKMIVLILGNVSSVVQFLNKSFSIVLLECTAWFLLMRKL